MKSLIVILCVILAVAYSILADRKGMGAMQRRVGPNQVGYLGLLQPFADALKLVLKETILPLEANHLLFVIAPFMTYYLSMLNWLVMPLGPGIALVDFPLSLLFILGVTSLGVYGIIYTGWSANSKYTLLGSLRSTSQMISYEISYSFIVLAVVYTVGSFNLLNIVQSHQAITLIFPLWPIFILSLITALAETNRAPMDLPEAESELVSGFMTEHSSITFTFIFLAEYTNILTISTLISIFFLGICNPILVYFFVWIRATLPRLRFDQLLSLGWSKMLPFLVGFMMMMPSFLFVMAF